MFGMPSRMCRLLMIMPASDGILPVKQRGIAGQWFSPWDTLIQVWGVEQAMMDLVLKPDLVNHVMTRMVDAAMAQMQQWEDLNLLSPNVHNDRVGSGGYGYTGLWNLIAALKVPYLGNANFITKQSTF